MSVWSPGSVLCELPKVTVLNNWLKYIILVNLLVWLHMLSGSCRCMSAALFWPLQQTYTGKDLTYSIKQSPWEANRLSLSQEITHILWNPKLQYHIHKCSLPVPILSQLDPVHNPTSHFLDIHLNIIVPSMPWSSMWSVSLSFPHLNTVYISTLPISSTWPAYLCFSNWSPEQYCVWSTDH